MFAPLFNVYQFYGQLVNLQMCVCYDQIKFFTRSKFNPIWSGLFDVCYGPGAGGGGHICPPSNLEKY